MTTGSRIPRRTHPGTAVDVSDTPNRWCTKVDAQRAPSAPHTSPCEITTGADITPQSAEPQISLSGHTACGPRRGPNMAGQTNAGNPNMFGIALPRMNMKSDKPWPVGRQCTPEICRLHPRPTQRKARDAITQCAASHRGEFDMLSRRRGLEHGAQKNPEAAGPRGAKDSSHFRARLARNNLCCVCSSPFGGRTICGSRNRVNPDMGVFVSPVWQVIYVPANAGCRMSAAQPYGAFLPDS
jgi:hypothetical protein